MHEIRREVKYYLPLNVTPKSPLCRFIQFSHSLITSEHGGRVSNLDKAIDYINHIREVDLVIHAGNVTQNSFKEEFILAKQKMDNLKYPYIVVPGYTDSIPPAWEYWRNTFGEYNPLFENEKIYFQGLNSTTRDSNEGFIGRNKMNNFIEKVLSLSHQKILGVCCFHSLIPTPMSVWRTELIDSGDVLSQFSRSQIDLCLNSTPSIAFNVKIDNTVFSNGGNLRSDRFRQSFIEIEIYKEGYVILKEHNLINGQIATVGRYNIDIFI
jgi:hypothetical protein